MGPKSQLPLLFLIFQMNGLLIYRYLCYRLQSPMNMKKLKKLHHLKLKH